MKLSIIIPVYNEEQTISTVVERVRAVDLGAIEKEIIVANDGSDDGTGRAIDAAREDGYGLDAGERLALVTTDEPARAARLLRRLYAEPVREAA